MDQLKLYAEYEGVRYILVLSQDQAGHPCDACAFNDKFDACKAALCRMDYVWKVETDANNKDASAGDIPG